MKTISELKQDIASKLHGTDISSVYNIDSVIKQAIAEVLANLDIPESKRIEPVEEGIVGGITRYKAPKFLKGSKIIALKKFRTSCNTGCEGVDIHHAFINHVMPSYQDYDDENPNISVEYINGGKYIKVKGFNGGCNCGPCQSSKQLIHSFDTFSCDYCSDRGCKPIEPVCCVPALCCGKVPEKTCSKEPDCKNPPEWRTYDRAGNLSINCNDYLTGKGSTQIDLTDCCDDNNIYTGGIEVKNLCPFDISDYKCGYFGLGVKIPNPKELISITLKFGQSEDDHYYTTTNDFKSLQAGNWQVLQFRLDLLERVGMPNMSDIKWIDIEFHTTGVGQTGILIDSLFLAKGTAYHIEYYSNTIIMDRDGLEYKEKITEEDDILNVEEDTYNIILDEILLVCSQELQGGDSRADTSYASQRLQNRYQVYKESHKSEMQPIIHKYI